MSSSIHYVIGAFLLGGINGFSHSWITSIIVLLGMMLLGFLTGRSEGRAQAKRVDDLDRAYVSGRRDVWTILEVNASFNPSDKTYSFTVTEELFKQMTK